MKSDEILQQDVTDALNWELLTAASAIKVSASNGVITLSGKVDHFAKKVQAETTVRNVAGVQSVVDNIDVTINTWEQKNDLEIKSELLNVFKWNWNTRNDTINVCVENGWVTLSGELEWNYQKEAAKTAASNLIGVKGVSNSIAIRSESDIEVQKESIERALKSHVAIDISNIKVAVSGHDLTLSGSVDSWFQKELAARIAWKAPGVFHVNNELLVEEE
ncbi:MAG: BON domain-containing protein [Flavobacterium sp.]|nr:BON domain-containing protein [Flavobacterium sp.]